MLRVTLYTKPGCGLCDEALDMLAELAAEVPHEVRAVSIVDDGALFEALWDKIPVLEVGEVRLEAPLGRAQMLDALRAARSQAV